MECSGQFFVNRTLGHLGEGTQIRKHLHQIVGKTTRGALFGLTLDVERTSLCGLHHTWAGMLGDRRQIGKLVPVSSIPQ